MVPMIWSWHIMMEVTVATADLTDRSCDAPVRGQSISISGDMSLVRDFAISLNPRGSTFSCAPGSSSSGGASFGELPGEAELESPLRAHCYSTRWCLAGAMVVVVPLEVSQGGGKTPHGGHRMRWMDF